MAKTLFLSTDAAQADRKWHVVDVAGLTLGRACTQIAHVIRGKHKPTFTAHVDSGDFVIVLNAGKIALTGKKLEGKLYYRHSLFPGGMTTFTAEQLLARKPTELIERAVWGMLPKGSLGRKMYKKLKVYAGDKHPHVAQKPSERKLAVA
ncbi:MAG: 50S ribosomal protein L13 [Elusimicrobiota bacterium]